MWIKVTQLPKLHPVEDTLQSDNLLTHDADGDIKVAYLSQHNKINCWFTIDGFITNTITHWQPLPNPPVDI
jgi:hypothetical protein